MAVKSSLASPENVSCRETLSEPLSGPQKGLFLDMADVAFWKILGVLHTLVEINHPMYFGPRCSKLGERLCGPCMLLTWCRRRCC